MADNKLSSKEFFRVYGIFISILLFFFMVIFGFIKLNSKHYDKKIAESIQMVLDEKQPDKWKVASKIKIPTGLSNSAGLYQLVSMDSAEKYWVLIVRISTYYGPMPAIFTYNKNLGTEFVGYAALKGRVRTILEENQNDTRLTYWISKVPEIIASTEATGVKK